MSILPVIDLQHGVVVRGVAGNRATYQPIESVLTTDPSPGSIAKALRERLHCDDVYVADLDAIGGQPPSWVDYAAIAESGLRMWIDAGIADMARAEEMLRAEVAGAPIHRVVIALETLKSRSDLISIIVATNPERLVFSIDLKDGRPLAASSDWSGATAFAIASDIIQLGIEQLIVLDLASVGVSQGTGTEELCRRIKREHPTVSLIGGGGVSSRGDVQRLCANGLSRVLVASAIHDGRIGGVGRTS